MTDYISQCLSRSLYNHLCDCCEIGDEKRVKAIRMMNNVRDNLSYDDGNVIITSGSFGEGIEMVFIDIDIMFVVKNIEVHENMSSVVYNENKTYFSTHMDDTRPGFTYLSLGYTSDVSILQKCLNVSGKLYLSNVLFKQQFACKGANIDHGPCLTDKFGSRDYAFCLHSKLWITPANHWITRPNTAWPPAEVKQTILDHGVIFVPIGVKGSKNEEVGWRLSFSVGEKLLIYSFNHTQLLCYVLMKILLRDVIDKQCKGLLCSYFLKTIIFWISEEVPLSEWTANNLIPCFMRCFRRLVYCVEYSVCPHYFIPDNNMFENKIEGPERQLLLNCLSILLSYGWTCILPTPQLVDFQLSLNPNISSFTKIDLVISIIASRHLSSLTCFFFEKHIIRRYAQAVKNLSRFQSTNIKRIHLYHLSVLCRDISQRMRFTSRFGNKFQHLQCKLSLHSLLQNIHHDAVSGWLMLASFFYGRHQYQRALKVMSYSLSKCTLEKMICCQNGSGKHEELRALRSIRKLAMFKILTLIQVTSLSFDVNSPLIPNELQLEVVGKICKIPPVVYAHFYARCVISI